MMSRFFGRYLLEKGQITAQQLFAALDIQKTVTTPIGILALENNWLTSEQIKQILDLQHTTNYRFGELAVRSGFLTQAQVDELLRKQDLSHRVMLGEALVSKGYLSLEALEREFREYDDEEKRRSVELAAAFDKVRDKHLVKTFTDLIMIMFSRFAKQELKIERCGMGEEKVRLLRWLFVQRVAGRTGHFNCLLMVPPKVMLHMASTMLEETVNAPDELALEASKEFFNIANGNACGRLSASGVDLRLQPPEVHEATNRRYSFQAVDVVCVHFVSADAELDLAFEFQP